MSSEGLYKLNEIALINPKRKVLKGNEVPFIEMAALPLSSRDIQKKDVEIRVAKNSGSHFKNGDTLLARITPCLENGKGAQVNCLSDGEIGEGSTEFIVLCGISSEDNDFVYYLTRTDEFRAYAISRMEGTSGRQRVSWQSIAAYEFYLPDLHFRRSAAALLTKIDDRITLLRETNATLEAIAQALFKSWFVDFDPVQANAHARTQHQNGHSQAVQQNPAPHAAEAIAQNLGLDAATAALFPDHFQDSDLGPIPAGWWVAPIKSACFKVESGGTPKRNISEYWNGEISWLSSGEIRNPIILETKEKISLLGVENSSAKIWPKDTTVVAMYGATAGEVCRLAIDSTANQACCALIPRENTAAFVFLNMRRDSAVLATKASGSAQQNLNKGLVESHLIVLPPDAVLSRFEEISGALIKGWIENEQQAQTLAQLRDTLLPRLISGKLRLPEAEAQIEELVGGA